MKIEKRVNTVLEKDIYVESPAFLWLNKSYAICQLYYGVTEIVSREETKNLNVFPPLTYFNFSN